MPEQSDILLCTINASYIHTSIGLRYLYANLDELQSRTTIVEFTTHLRAADIVEKILLYQPKIIGFGIYIWNSQHSQQVISLLKIITPETIIIIGGPEVSYEYEQQKIFQLADFLIQGAADLDFVRLCRQIKTEQSKTNSNIQLKSLITKVYPSKAADLQQIKLPYQYYNDEDIKNRVLYVEASRGCPFKCEFCLSALDKTALPFDIDLFLQEMECLYQRGGRNFKFVDRTFNLKTQSSIKILEFFLKRLDEKLFLHFEIIPDRLPSALKEIIIKFPAGSLQFELGVQSFNPEVQALISRKQDNKKTLENIHWLKKYSQAHIHADLIFGLPGEDIESFAKGFNQLYNLQPHDIQLGILKRLRGTPVIRHTEKYQLKFDHSAPYSILSTTRINFQLMQRMARFARYWELIVNSGCFKETLSILLNENTFENFLRFSDWLYDYSGKTHRISQRKLFDYVYYGFKKNLFFIYTDKLNFKITEALLNDYRQAGLKGQPEFCKNP
ncbi:MAG: DUF4080 domain-containing protein [gamma proteobacterium symbiont of Taylorina sp.]|nr:DUF4080 domain-containing protein [gamma proteobacterium symbiont of Taylorina sp.]